MHAPWFAPLFALTLFAVALSLPALLPMGRAAQAHMVLALGVAPLILAAMGHFTPVLTRGAPPPRLLRWLPPLALLSGLGVFGFLRWGWPVMPWAAAGLLVVTTLQGGWMVRRARAAFGVPHPGLAWYLAALGCLAAALAAIALAGVWPEQWGALRRLHLHLNLLGFVGLTALGTLWVLLPTVAGYAAPAVGERLRVDLPIALGGTVLSAVGAAWWWPAAMAGGIAWLVVVARFVVPLFRRHRQAVWGGAGASRALALAAVGLTINVAAGLLHGAGGAGPASAMPFILGFLLPLVTGAAAHLIPLWRWPGPPSPAREAARLRLAGGHGWRGALFLLCGIASLAGIEVAPYLAAAGVAQFLLQALHALHRARHERSAGRETPTIGV